MPQESKKQGREDDNAATSLLAEVLAGTNLEAHNPDDQDVDSLKSRNYGLQQLLVKLFAENEVLRTQNACLDESYKQLEERYQELCTKYVKVGGKYKKYKAKWDKVQSSASPKSEQKQSRSKVKESQVQDTEEEHSQPEDEEVVAALIADTNEMRQSRFALKRPLLLASNDPTPVKNVQGIAAHDNDFLKMSTLGDKRYFAPSPVKKSGQGSQPARALVAQRARSASPQKRRNMSPEKANATPAKPRWH
ncbi:SubName: Full=Uncharacterized protein {ECO:0000313/EMBL:CCA69896.1} [Serendipita indica DSM 11827]|uniref:Uncharacterized protein n=1 Tax=Serendipita indica (strain DSM 11827) TaxID=1109443 RepID=G4TF09_SERID|nr:SubName: Full=Uncharacterized protein {ECO:0000313/EMBL:CCA69896.1} [Serendipita indica DSM 11827]CCA69896.1 hypothetical protein PIIN_03836 [Serendipita indica DSM 11827]